MEWLNYHHLLYFWVVAREGTIAAAARELSLAPSTISEQIRLLEESLDQKLFRRSGRNIVLTGVGQEVYRYADDIFRLGRELLDYAAGRRYGRVHLHVGVSMVLPKQIALRLLAPALEMEDKVHLICREGPTDDLLADLALHHLDIVLTDAPLGPDSRIRAFNHLLGECGVVIAGTPELAERYREGFPQSLDGAPVLMPTSTTVLRRQLDRWLDAQGIRPEIIAEFDDSALLKVFGQRGVGVFPIPEAVADEIYAQYGVEHIGNVCDVVERFYAVSVERKLQHPAVIHISQTARERLFADTPGVVTASDPEDELDDDR